MVQKKVPQKLALQPLHVVKKTKNQSQPHDAKIIKGPELKKMKMKKSGSIKRQEPNAPNYMKSTTSSNARKEEVSTKTDHSSLRRKSSNNTKLTLPSANKATKTSSLKTTKNPSFKPARASKSVRTCPQVVLCENLEAQRATCSSTLKDSKFPAYLSLNHGGTESEGASIIKVCPYTYCSLNGHRHAPLPPLKCFLSGKRRMMKTQRSLKLGRLSPRRVKGFIGDGSKIDERNVIEEEVKDFFVEIHVEKNEDQEERVMDTVSVDANESVDAEDANLMDVKEDETKQGLMSELQVESMEENVRFNEQDFEVSDMEWETDGHHSALHLDYDYEYESSPETDIKSSLDGGEIVESGIIDEDEFIINKDGLHFDEFLADEISQESFDDEESFNLGAFSNSDDDGESTDIERNSTPVELSSEEPDSITNNLVSNQISSEEAHHQLQNESSDEDQTCNTENQENFTDDFINISPLDQSKERCFEAAHAKSAKFKAEKNVIAKSETENSALVLAISKCKKPIDDPDESGEFNPRAPNFLPLEPSPEAEKVDLKHQDVDERKNAEEWMVDYALRQVVTKLGPARKRKVALLVEAFEKVTPPIKKCELHLRNTAAFNQAIPMQACS